MCFLHFKDSQVKSVICSANETSIFSIRCSWNRQALHCFRTGFALRSARSSCGLPKFRSLSSLHRPLPIRGVSSFRRSVLYLLFDYLHFGWLHLLSSPRLRRGLFTDPIPLCNTLTSCRSGQPPRHPRGPLSAAPMCASPQEPHPQPRYPVISFPSAHWGTFTVRSW